MKKANSLWRKLIAMKSEKRTKKQGKRRENGENREKKKKLILRRQKL